MVCVAASVLLVLILIAAFFVIPPLAFRREPKFRDDYSLTLSSEGIHFRTAHIHSKLQWSMYSRALIDSHSYVLYYGLNQFSVIPRRVFRSVDEQREFEEMLTKHVATIEKKNA